MESVNAKYQQITFSKIIPATIKEVYFSFTNHTALEAWFANAVSLSVQPGGRFYAWWDTGYTVNGSFVSVNENEELVLNWQGMGESSTKVSFSFEETDEGTLVTINRSETGQEEFWTEINFTFKRIVLDLLDNLEFLLTKGFNKRVYQQPFLGVLIAGFIDAKQAEELGVSVKHGVRLIGSMEDTGAAKIGIQNDDVLVTLADVDLKEFSDFAKAVEGYKADDEISVVYHRGSEVIEGKMRLSRRPFPEVPDTPEELADKASEIYSGVNAELEEAFEGVSEAEANQQPKEGEWSAKQVVAHLLYTERWFNMNVANQSGGERAPSYNNDYSSLAALADQYSSVQQLILELKKAESLSVASLRNLPSEIVNRKHIYYGFAGWPLQGVEGHTRSHLQQISEAINIARKKQDG